MRCVSQLVTVLLLVGVVVSAVAVLASTVLDVVESHRPRQVALARIGDGEVDLVMVSRDFYVFSVSVGLVNLGTTPVDVEGGYIVVLVRGSTGRGEVLKCPVEGGVTLAPGEAGAISAQCLLWRRTLLELFGTGSPRGDDVKRAITLLHLDLWVGGGRLTLT